MNSTMPGAVIADRYRLVRPLGAGSSATVWEASDLALNRTVALKLLHGAALANPTERERLRREARALARLAHPRIMIVFDYLEQLQPDGTQLPVLVTELLTGAPLAERLRSGPLPADETVAVCAQLADALQAAHQAGIVHRDVKPGNVMLTAGGVKLLDFGIAQAATDSNLTGNMAIGTPACMAPEQLTGRGAVPASDVYALGCVMHWCLTGRPPYASPDIVQVAQGHVYAPVPTLEGVPGLPIGVAEVYARCMSKDPAMRPSAAEVFARLTQVQSSASAPQPPLAHQTMVMQPFDLPMQTAAEPRPGNGDHASVSAPPASRPKLIAGAVAIALVAAGITALVLETGKSHGAASAPPSSPSSASALSGQSTPTDSTSPSASATTSLGPASDPIAYLEGMGTQIDGFIAQGQDTIDPNTGRDLQNSIGDLENAVSTAINNGGRHQQRDALDKIGNVQQKIADDLDNGTISQDAATQLTTELQNLSDALQGASGDGGNNN